MKAILNIDTEILLFIHEQLANVFFDFLMPLITLLAEHGIVPILLCTVLLCFKRTRKTGAVMSLAVILGFLIGNLTLKPLIARVRPYDAISGIQLLIAKQPDFSFPSGHTLVSFECAMTLVFCRNRFRYLAVILAVLIAFSRLYLFVHYPTDVLGGAILGTIFAFAAKKCVDCISERVARAK